MDQWSWAGAESIGVGSKLNITMGEQVRAGKTPPKVVILGPTGVGKTSLAVRLTREEFTQDLPTLAMRGVRMLPLFEGTETESLLIEGGVTGGTVDFDHPTETDLAEHDFSAAIVVTGPANGEDAPSYFVATAEWLQKKINRLPFKKFIIANGREPEDTSHQEVWDRVARQYSFDGVFRANARIGDGIQELRTAILDAVQWQRDQEP